MNFAIHTKQLGRIYKIRGGKKEDPKELDAAIQEMLDFDGPYLLHVKVEKEENIFPMIPSGSSVSEIRLE